MAVMASRAATDGGTASGSCASRGFRLPLQDVLRLRAGMVCMLLTLAGWLRGGAVGTGTGLEVGLIGSGSGDVVSSIGSDVLTGDGRASALGDGDDGESGGEAAVCLTVRRETFS